VTLVSLAFWALRLPSPVLWGVVTALFSLIPNWFSGRVGARDDYPGFSGHWWKGLILLAGEPRLSGKYTA